MRAYFTPNECLALAKSCENHPTLAGTLQDYVSFKHEVQSWKNLKSKISLPAQKKRCRWRAKNSVLSLNCGGFGVDSHNFTIDDTFQEKSFAKLLKHIQTHQFGLVHLQDYPYTPNLLARLAEATGYALHAVPQVFLTHTHPDAQDSGLIVLSHPDLEVTGHTYRFHETNLPKASGYKRVFTDEEMLLVNGTLSYRVVLADQTYRLTNLYVSPISTRKTRYEVFRREAELARSFPRWLLTGDTNLYGIDTLRPVLGILSANPCAFVPCAAASLFTGKNRFHRHELRRVRKTFALAGIKTVNDPTVPSISFALKNHLPKPLRWLVGQKRVYWALDLAFSNDPAFNAYLDRTPFGDFDHASLHVFLSSKD